MMNDNISADTGKTTDITIMLFAGTTEGRKLCEYLIKDKAVNYITHVYVTTEYGKELILEFTADEDGINVSDRLNIHVGKLDEDGILAELGRIRPDIVIDATHPYARVVTHNIKDACNKDRIHYIRVLREESALPVECGSIRDNDQDHISNKGNQCNVNDSLNINTNITTKEWLVYTESMEDVIKLLNSREYIDKKVLLTTGSKNIPEYVSINNYKQRVYLRLLPDPDMLKKAIDAGLLPAHLIGMQGPFSKEMNIALIRQLDIDVLVTKESGNSGGYNEKLMAGKQTGTTVVVIKRPVEKDGKSLLEVIEYLKSIMSVEKNKVAEKHDRRNL